MQDQPTTTLLILGAGGHGRVVADAALVQRAWQRVIASARDQQEAGRDLLPGIPVLSLPDARAMADEVHVAIGSATAREREAAAIGLPLASVIHPRASVSVHAQVQPGCFIAALSVIGPCAELGRGVIVNHAAVVDHEVRVGDFTHIAPGVTLAGKVQVGARVLVGAGANVLPNVRIADDVVIGAGAVVTGDIDAPGVYAGVPARRVR